MADETSGSASHALGARAAREEEYRRVAAPEVEDWLTSLASGLLSGGGLTLAAALAAWGALVVRVERSVGASSTLPALLRESDLPGIAYEAGTAQIADAAALGVTAAERRARVTTVLGLNPAPVPGLGGALGRIVAPSAPGAAGETRQLSWEGAIDGASRTAATADDAVDTLDQLRAEGYTHKRWMTRFDSRVRPTHEVADRQTILLDEEFVVGGSRLRYPADPMCPDVSEVANCRCVLVGVIFDTTAPPVRAGLG